MRTEPGVTVECLHCGHVGVLTREMLSRVAIAPHTPIAASSSPSAAASAEVKVYSQLASRRRVPRRPREHIAMNAKRAEAIAVTTLFLSARECLSLTAPPETPPSRRHAGLAVVGNPCNVAPVPLRPDLRRQRFACDQRHQQCKIRRKLLLRPRSEREEAIGGLG